MPELTPYTAAILSRHAGNAKRAIEWMETERAQVSYISSNTRHKPTIAECSEVHGRLSAAIEELRNMPRPESAIRSDEKTALSIAAVGCIVSFACYAAAILPHGAHAEIKPAGYAILAVDSIGEGWIAGRGDTCESAAVGAVYPADMVSSRCIPSSDPMAAE